MEEVFQSLFGCGNDASVGVGVGLGVGIADDDDEHHRSTIQEEQRKRRRHQGRGDISSGPKKQQHHRRRGRSRTFRINVNATRSDGRRSYLGFHHNKSFYESATDLATSLVTSNMMMTTTTTTKTLNSSKKQQTNNNDNKLSLLSLLPNLPLETKSPTKLLVVAPKNIRRRQRCKPKQPTKKTSPLKSSLSKRRITNNRNIDVDGLSKQKNRIQTDDEARQLLDSTTTQNISTPSSSTQLIPVRSICPSLPPPLPSSSAVSSSPSSVSSLRMVPVPSVSSSSMTLLYQGLKSRIAHRRRRRSGESFGTNCDHDGDTDDDKPPVVVGEEHDSSLSTKCMTADDDDDDDDEDSISSSMDHSSRIITLVESSSSSRQMKHNDKTKSRVFNSMTILSSEKRRSILQGLSRKVHSMRKKEYNTFEI